jgi:thiol:disulfide interchange protein
MIRRPITPGLLTVAIIVAGGLAPRLVGEDKKPRAKLGLYANVTAIQPGEHFSLAVQFDIEEQWHIYWRNPGDSGLAPSVQWKASEGVSIGAPQFPTPTRHTDRGGLVTNVLEGRPVLLVPVTASRDLKPGATVELAADVSYLVCKEVCLREQETVKLSLPVAQSSQAANEEIFNTARRRLPVPASSAKYLKLGVKSGVDRVGPGDTFQLSLILDIEKDYHIADATSEEVPANLFLDASEGIEFGKPVFPPGQTKQVPVLGTVKGYAGETIIRIPCKADYLTGNTVRLGGVLVYQACDDRKGVCYPPTSVEWSINLPAAKEGEAVSKADTGRSDSEGAPSVKAPPPAPSAGETGTGGFSLDGDVRLAETRPQSLWIMLVFAVVAGLILNVTPCVLPVISIKILSFVQQAGDDSGRVFRHGLAFAAGMMAVFEVLAALAVVFGLAWGQHFQKPEFIVGISAVIFAFALSMFGVFTLGVPRALGDLSVRAEREGYTGAFAKGALATVLGTPCLGPFLGSVLAYALSQPTTIVFLIFNAIGLGMAAPYVILTSRPSLLRFVPKPGAWMETFKQLMGFLLLGTVVYLLHVLSGIAGASGVVWTLAFFLAVGLACWVIGRFVAVDTAWPRRLGVWGTGLAICVAGWLIAFGGRIDVAPGITAAASVPTNVAQAKIDSSRLGWIDFSLDKLTDLTASGKTVLVDFTADWCPNCKYNLRFVLNTQAVKDKVAQLNAVTMLADWTAENETIEKTIKKLGGTTIPLLAVFPAGRPNQPIVIDGILAQAQVLGALDQAGPSQGKTAAVRR